ncbi:MAG: histidinol-phosphate transaminase [Desulforhopalus sp.]|nr:histidinol-phosphate transaminase [Desulforhopalus sp.]
MAKQRSTLVRPEVAGLPRYNAGLPEEYVRDHFQVDHIARLAGNENPFGIGVKAREAAATALGDLGKYPDPESRRLRQALSVSLDCSEPAIVIGNGSEELIALLCRACLRPGDRVVTVTPSFLLHEIYPAEQGAVVVTVPMADDFSFAVDDLLAAMTDSCRMLLLSTPANPVGTMLTSTDLQRIAAAAHPETLLVIDEAYYEYAREEADYPDSRRLLEAGQAPFVLLRTFSKAFGLAGLRIGYGLFSDLSLAGHIDKLRTPFNVNRMAQVAALAALGDQHHLEKTLAHNRNERARLADELIRRGYRVAPSHANFLFFDVGMESAKVAEQLLSRGIVVKPWGQAGFRQFIRVTVGSRRDNDLFLDALAEIT